MITSKMKAKIKLVALANLLLASCWGTSCTTDLRDAVWSGTLDYVTATTDGFLAMNVWPAEVE